MTADTLPKLEPCPWCGKCQKMERAPKIPAYWASYRCRDKGTFQTEAEAVAFWNKRSDQKIRDAKAEAWEEAALVVRTSRTYNDLKVNLSMREVCMFFVEQFMARAKAIRGGE